MIWNLYNNAKIVVPTLTLSELGITNNSSVFIMQPISSHIEISLKMKNIPVIKNSNI